LKFEFLARSKSMLEYTLINVLEGVLGVPLQSEMDATNLD